MTGIIVVFPNKDNATNIRNLLARGGMDAPTELLALFFGWCTSRLVGWCT